MTCSFVLVVSHRVDALFQRHHPVTARLLRLTPFNSPALALNLSNHQDVDVHNNISRNNVFHLVKALANKVVFPNNSQFLNAKTRVLQPVNQLVLNQFNSNNQLNNSVNKTVKQLAQHHSNNSHNASSSVRLLASLMTNTTNN